MRKFERISMALVIVSLLAACGGSGGDGDPTFNPIDPGDPVPVTGVTLQGTLLVGEQPSGDINSTNIKPSPWATLQTLGVEGLNQSLLLGANKGEIGVQSVKPPIRGRNALMLQRLVQAQAGQTALFGFGDKTVVAVNEGGEVVGEGSVEASGSFSVEVPTDETVAVVIAEENKNDTPSDESDDFYVCGSPLEYDEGGSVDANPDDNRLALFNFDSLPMGTLQSGGSPVNPNEPVNLGLFGFSAENGNPDAAADSKIPGLDNSDAVEDGFETDSDSDGQSDFLGCGAGNQSAVAPVTADFDWSVPENLDETFLYKYGIGFGYSPTEMDEVLVEGVAGLEDTGVMNMDVSKVTGNDVALALAIMDVGFMEFSSPELLEYPLVPFFDLNAAINLGEPTFPLEVAVGDEGYDYGTLSGGMAIVSGTVTDATGAPAPNIQVVGFLDSETVLDFNLAITNENGYYQMLLPAVPGLRYLIGALSEDGTQAGGDYYIIDTVDNLLVDVQLEAVTSP